MANNASTTETAASTDSAAETDFFSGYKWCLNPIMKLNDLWTRMESELHRFPGLKASWQCEESKVNLYLFACAISCTVDDYFSRRHYIRPLADHFPKLRRGVSLAEDMINMTLTVGGMLKFKEVSRFRAKLDEFVEHVCNLLLSTEYSVESRLLEIESCFGELRSSVVSAALGNARMRLNEGYRCQDLTYHDLITLAERYIETGPELEGRFLVVGARTAGSYFAPLLKVYLEGRGASNISWVTVRPKYGTHGIERKRLRQLLRDEPTVILTDDYSNTGRTFRMMEQTMRSLGVRQDKMVLLAPIHPVRSALDRVRQAGNNWKKPEEKLSSSEETKVISILHDDLYLKKMLEPQSVLSLLADVYMNNGPGEVSVIPSKWADEVNRELWSHYSDSFQVRLKGVYEILLINADGQVENRKIFAKNVGPGWLGYHAYIAGKTLKTFVPGIVGLRRVPTLQVSLSELTI